MSRPNRKSQILFPSQARCSFSICVSLVIRALNKGEIEPTHFGFLTASRKLSLSPLAIKFSIVSSFAFFPASTSSRRISDKPPPREPTPGCGGDLRLRDWKGD